MEGFIYDESKINRQSPYNQEIETKELSVEQKIGISARQTIVGC